MYKIIEWLPVAGLVTVKNVLENKVLVTHVDVKNVLLNVPMMDMGTVVHAKSVFQKSMSHVSVNPQ